jgi:hypothetical protein
MANSGRNRFEQQQRQHSHLLSLLTNGTKWRRLIGFARHSPPTTKEALTMKLFLIAQDENNGWDTYDSAVVAAEDEEQARQINPRNGWPMTERDWNRDYSDWCSTPERVRVQLLGVAEEDTEAGVICASFNAG